MGDYILHYGVKGMKWGVRKDQNNNTRALRGKKQLAEEASKYYKSEADKRKSSGVSRIQQIEKQLNSNNKMSDNEVDALFREWSAIDSSFRTLNSRAEEIQRNSKLGKQYINEYKKNVPIDKLLKAYSYDYAYYQYNIKGDKEWLLDWGGRSAPKF